MSTPVWFPTDPASTNVGRFMAAHGIARYEDLERRSVEDPEWFWDAVVKFLDIDFPTAYHQVLDVSDSIPWARWFVGGKTNFAHVAVDRHPPERPAIVWEGEDGDVRTWTYGELRAQADGLAALLVERDIGEGDAVGVYMPMIPETVAAVLGIAKAGAVFLPLFSGFGAEAAVTRMNDAGAKALITSASFRRRGKTIPMGTTAKEAVTEVPTVELVVEAPEWPAPAPAPARSPSSEAFATRMVDSEHPLF
ncbi:MAG: AMP-binding protein, partial [Acidimicrobiia bacterium]|nr:AMP-binding protein [Acidimicrobiia bacterium]